MAAVGTTTITASGTRPKKITLAWTSSAGGAVSGTPTTQVRGEIKRVTFIPGTGNDVPTAAYDVVVLDASGVDVLAGLGANLSETAVSHACPLIGNGVTTTAGMFVNDTLL
jgi:hypothetical protein